MSTPFPSPSLLPHLPTAAASYLTSHPDLPGSTVTCAILDTGVDPCADGMAGKNVTIDDCTGSGDVVLKKVDAKDLPKEYSLSLEKDDVVFTVKKRLYDLLNGKVLNRVKTYNKEQATIKFKDLISAASESTVESVKSKEDEEKKTNQEDLKQALQDMLKSYEDPGPIYNIISVKRDGAFTTYMGLGGELGSVKELNVPYKFDTLTNANYALSAISESADGVLLTVTTDAGAHGTHVANIVASATSPGVASSASIKSLKIGDTRLGSMETGVGVMRAIKSCEDCEVVNMSYGEAVALQERGRIKHELDRLAWSKNVIFLASAGNNGPGLSTVGAPGGMVDSVISVGAWVGEEMMEAQYSIRDVALTTQSTYTWSSVGPCHNGAFGVDIIAPGGAITGVPEWCLQKKQLMNGTSMSSPNAAGCVSLICDGLKKEGIKWTTERVRKGVFNTAKNVKGLSVLQEGWGMIQVEEAFEWIKKFKDVKEEDVRYDVTINRTATPKGVYLRQLEECNKKQVFTVNVDPQFGYDDVSAEMQDARAKFEMKCKISLSTDETWVTHPEFLLLVHNGRSFGIEVDATNLAPGVHTCRLEGRDTDDLSRGVQWYLPITVVKPHPPPPTSTLSLGQINFAPSERVRFFLTPPNGATFADIRIKDCRPIGDDASTRLMVLHCLQITPHTPYRDREAQFYTQLTPGEVCVKSVPIVAGVTLELCLARYWSALGLTESSIDVTYRGVVPTPDSVMISPGGAGTHVTVMSVVDDEVVMPSAKLDKWETALRPKTSSIAPIQGERNVMLDGKTRVQGLTLTYEMKLEEGYDVIFKAELLNGYLYESEYESQMGMIYSEGKKLLGVVDAYPEKVKCPKGTITVRFLIRHDSIEMLKKLSDMVVIAQRDLSKSIPLTAYATHGDMMVGGKKFGKRIIQKGNLASMHFGVPGWDKMPKGAVGGDVLRGKVDYEFTEKTMEGEGKKPGGYDICYVVPIKPAKKEESKPFVSEVKDERSEMEKMKEDLRDWKVARLEKKVGEEGFEELYEDCKEEWSEWLPLLAVRVKHLEKKLSKAGEVGEGGEGADAPPPAPSAVSKSSLLSSISDVVALIDQDALAIWNGTKHDSTDGAVSKKKKEMDRQKKILEDVLGRKCLALMGEEGFDEAVSELKKWVKVEGNDKFAALEIESLKSKGLYGSVLKVVKKLGEGEGTKGGLKEYKKADLLKVKGGVLKELGWEWLGEHEKKWEIIEGMKDYQAF
ncbi:hypothetical protein TrST_g11129 [Triparma strigata]|uniref:Tripeptidyl-peptidase II n=1 Tax=Triparma strigata TaxID=1606541 RepID=A0A9W7F2P7_9STRA|nr:hypothetical protein TrST_g11129 [Triparma strigata]